MYHQFYSALIKATKIDHLSQPNKLPLMQTRTRLLHALLIAQAVLLFACKKNDGFDLSNETAYADSTSALQSAADFPIGVAISYTPMLNDPKYAATVQED